MKDKQKLRLALAGTVAFPPAGQGASSVAVSCCCDECYVTVETSTDRTSVKRTFSSLDVRAVKKTKSGKWLIGEELNDWLQCTNSTKGVVYVTENAQTLLEVSTGMTAAEAVEYYPPLAAAVNAPSSPAAPSPSGYVDGVGCAIGCSGSGGDIPMGGC